MRAGFGVRAFYRGRPRRRIAVKSGTQDYFDKIAGGMLPPRAGRLSSAMRPCVHAACRLCPAVAGRGLDSVRLQIGRACQMGVKQVVGLLSVALVLHLAADSGWSVEGMSGGAVRVADPNTGPGDPAADPAPDCTGGSETSYCTDDGMTQSGCSTSYVQYSGSGAKTNTAGLTVTTCKAGLYPTGCEQTSYAPPKDGCKIPKLVEEDEPVEVFEAPQ